MEVPLIVRLAAFARYTKEFGMVHKKINTFHPCVFLPFRCLVAVSAMPQPSITLLIGICSSFAMMIRWKKLEFGGGYIGTQGRVNRRENILESDV